MNAGRPRPRRRLEREVRQCLPEDDGLRSAHGRGGSGSRPRRRPSRHCSKRRPLVVELGEVAGEGRILERPDPSSLASRRRAVGVGRSSVAADTRAAAGGGRRGCHGTAGGGRRRRRRHPERRRVSPRPSPRPPVAASPTAKPAAARPTALSTGSGPREPRRPAGRGLGTDSASRPSSRQPTGKSCRSAPPIAAMR